MSKIIALALLAALCVGCVAPRLTTEVLWPGDEKNPPEVVVIWPEGVAAGDVWTGDANGRTVSVAPVLLP